MWILTEHGILTLEGKEVKEVKEVKNIPFFLLQSCNYC